MAKKERIYANFVDDSTEIIKNRARLMIDKLKLIVAIC